MVDSLSKILYKKEYTTNVDEYIKEYLGTLPNINEINDIVNDYEELVVNDFVENSVNIIINNLMYKRISSNSDVINVFFFNTLTDELADYMLSEYETDICIQLPFNVLMGFVEENVYARKVYDKLTDYGYCPSMTHCKTVWWKKPRTEMDEEGNEVEKVDSIPIQVSTLRINITYTGPIKETTEDEQ